MSKLEIRLQFGPPEVEGAVLESKLLRWELVLGSPVHRNLRGPRRREAFDRLRPDLDRTRGELGIGVGPDDDLSLDRDHVLRPQRSRDGEVILRSPVGTEGHLDEPGSVAEIDEEEAAEVAASVHPPGEADTGAFVLGAECADHGGAEGGGSGETHDEASIGCIPGVAGDAEDILRRRAAATAAPISRPTRSAARSEIEGVRPGVKLWCHSSESAHRTPPDRRRVHPGRPRAMWRPHARVVPRTPYRPRCATLSFTAHHEGIASPDWSLKKKRTASQSVAGPQATI
jgi:hypothetical protein